MVKTFLKSGALIFMLSVMPLFAVSAENYFDLDFGAVYSNVSSLGFPSVDGTLDGSDSSLHLGIGAYRNKDTSKWAYGVKLEMDDVAGNLLLSVRVIDFKYQVMPKFNAGGFIGAARWDLATPAFGYRIGVGTNYRFAEHWALGTDVSYSDTVARDKVLPGEEGGTPGPALFYDILQVSLFMKYIF